MFSKKRAKILYKEIKKFGLEEEMLSVFGKYIAINDELNKYSKLLYDKLEDKTVEITEELAIKLLNENKNIAMKIREFQDKKVDVKNEMGELVYKISYKILNAEHSKNFNKVLNINKFKLNENQMVQFLCPRITNDYFLEYISKKIKK